MDTAFALTRELTLSGVLISGSLGRLPELDAVALGIHDPGEAAVLSRFDFRIHFDSLAAKRGQERIEVPHPVIDHERSDARLEVPGVSWKRRPDRPGGALRLGLLAPLEGDVAVAIHRKAKVRLVPLRQGPGILRLEKHSSENPYPLHGLISFFVNELTDLGKYYRAAKKPFRGLLRTKPLTKLNF